MNRYKTWLEKQGYTPSTVEASIKALRRLDNRTLSMTKSDVPLLRRYVRFLQEIGEHPEIVTRLKKKGITASAQRENPGLRPTKLLTAAQLHRLKQRFESRADDASLALILYMGADKMPGELLRMPIAKVLRDVPCTSSACITWLKSQPLTWQLYETVSKSYSWAYRKLLAELKKEAKALDIVADLGTLRRSRLQLL